ncbi:hypothetical protein LC653_00155 [Nostoc sp. CHAB 5784]|uniref:hypothetical protein n=1 Tax=Nostoc mirabile TaxID=2907820 RepID=UPI001E4A977E|nr:hypothetical protein [Nostoc mirabile]MCC5662387.1 hypothetical protein [Nostoc mirabile CHAB5784]
MPSISTYFDYATSAALSTSQYKSLDGTEAEVSRWRSLSKSCIGHWALEQREND